MNKVVYLVAAFSLLFLNSSVTAISCLQGQRLLLGTTQLSNDLNNTDCPLPSQICHRYDITASAQGQTGKNNNKINQKENCNNI